MYVIKNNDSILIRTPFSAECDLVQKFSGITEFPTGFNHPLNFTEAGLILRRKWDMWHIDIPFAISNDEAPPVVINGEWLGANHEFPGAVTLHIPCHGKTAADIGSIWQDEEGTKWILISALEDTLTFISENIGESDVKYAFKKRIASKLTYIENGANHKEVSSEVELWEGVLKPVIRHTKRRAVAYINGEERVINRGMECDYVEIHEEYEIVNPVSMIENICKNRPAEGYKTEIYSAVGDTMAKVSRIYRIENDGTILCDFTCKKLTDIQLSRCMGAMFQEKLDAFGGGIHRYIPKMIPIDTPQGIFDFSAPVDTGADNFPANSHVTEKYWERPDNPPDRIVDYFYNGEGKARLGFVCGYLPLYDALPEIRAKSLESAVHLIRTRKGYPYFIDSDFTEAHGIAYRKYFETSDEGVSVYTIPYMGKEYLYVDLFEGKNIFLPIEKQLHLHEKSDGIEYRIENGMLTITGTKGYAVFVVV